MSVLFCEAPDRFRAWLTEHHAERDEVWVGYYRKTTGRPSITWPESVDEALCFGWIDGIRKSIDEESYKVRFTPRRRGSKWSRVNLERVSVLITEQRMTPAGMDAYGARDPEDPGYSLARDDARFTTEQEAAFKARTKAWAFWSAQPPGYRKQATRWVISAKREDTRESRLETLIEDSARGLRIKQLRRD